MTTYISETEARARFGTSKPSELKGQKIPSAYGKPWRIVKAEMLDKVDEESKTFLIKLELK
jgi:hypothetical protein